LIGIASLIVPLGMRGCCESTGLSLGRFSGFMDLSYRLSLDVDLSLFTSFELGGRIGAWADIELLADLELNLDLDAVIFKQASLQQDIDRDGKEESVSLLAAVDEQSGEAVRVFVAWKGDEYTLDEGRCYLAWVEGDSLRLASASCGERESPIICSAPIDDPDRLSCQSCTEEGECTQCDTKGEADDCRPEQAVEPDGSGQGRDAGVFEDAAVDGSVEPDAATGAVRSACEKQVKRLAAEVEACGLNLSLEAELLCEGDMGAVQACFSAWVTADTLGQDICPVLGQESVCGVLR
jgi:hypothetical protein